MWRPETTVISEVEMNRILQGSGYHLTPLPEEEEWTIVTPMGITTVHIFDSFARGDVLSARKDGYDVRLSEINPREILVGGAWPPGFLEKPTEE